MANVMRILHVTDFHFRQRWFHWLMDQGPHYDVCCFTGDFLDMFPGMQMGVHRQARWVRDWVQEFPGRIFMCSGNHDWWPRDPRVRDPECEAGWLRAAARAGVWVDGASEVVSGYRFVCRSWGTELTSGLDAESPTVLLAHAPPQGQPTAIEMGDDIGCERVSIAAGTLRTGSIVLSGHVHQPRRWCARLGKAWSFNPGVDFAASVPNHIVIDIESRQATFCGHSRQIGPVSLSEAQK